MNISASFCAQRGLSFSLHFWNALVGALFIHALFNRLIVGMPVSICSSWNIFINLSWAITPLPMWEFFIQPQTPFRIPI